MNTKDMILRIWSIATSAVILLAAVPGSAQILGTAGSYGALGGSTVTNTGSTVILGDLGVSPGLAITGFNAIDGGPGQFTGAVNQGNAAALLAQSDLTAAYITLAGLAFTSDLTGQDLGGMNLTPGVYFFSSSAQLTGALTLDALGDANARFVFQIGSTLTTATDSIVNLVNLGGACGPDAGIFWQVGSSATIGVNTDFTGSILALTSITLNTGASIDYGRALARNGAVTLDSNVIDARDPDAGYCPPDGREPPPLPVLTPVPEPSTYGLIGSVVLLLAVWRRRVAGRRSNGLA